MTDTAVVLSSSELCRNGVVFEKAIRGLPPIEPPLPDLRHEQRNPLFHSSGEKKIESLHKGAEDLVREQRDHALQCLPGHHDRELSQDFAAEGGGGQRGEGLAGLTYCREGGGGHAVEDSLDELGGVGGKDWYTGGFLFPRRAHRLAEEDRLAALSRNQEDYDLFLSTDPARRRRGTVTPRSSDCVSLANRTRRPYGPGSKKRCRACDLDCRTRERRAADAVQRAAEKAGKANRGRRREEEKLATLFRLPLLTRPLPTTPVVTHDPDKGKPFRPAVPKLYACPKSFQTSARTSTEGNYTESECL
ncbi:hypothetical protein JADG_008166 [Aureobasidium aubasidani]|nr:hypothetical protein JADG_008166 [Aureobasidium pullulans]